MSRLLGGLLGGKSDDANPTATKVNDKSLGKGADAMFFDKKLNRWIIGTGSEIEAEKKRIVEEQAVNAAPPPAMGASSNDRQLGIDLGGRKFPAVKGLRVAPSKPSTGPPPGMLGPGFIAPEPIGVTTMNGPPSMQVKQHQPEQQPWQQQHQPEQQPWQQQKQPGQQAEQKHWQQQPEKQAEQQHWQQRQSEMQPEHQQPEHQQWKQPEHQQPEHQQPEHQQRKQPEHQQWQQPHQQEHQHQSDQHMSYVSQNSYGSNPFSPAFASAEGFRPISRQPSYRSQNPEDPAYDRHSQKVSLSTRRKEEDINSLRSLSNKPSFESHHTYPQVSHHPSHPQTIPPVVTDQLMQHSYQQGTQKHEDANQWHQVPTTEEQRPHLNTASTLEPSPVRQLPEVLKTHDVPKRFSKAQSVTSDIGHINTGRYRTDDVLSNADSTRPRSVSEWNSRRRASSVISDRHSVSQQATERQVAIDSKMKVIMEQVSTHNVPKESHYKDIENKFHLLSTKKSLRPPSVFSAFSTPNQSPAKRRINPDQTGWSETYSMGAPPSLPCKPDASADDEVKRLEAKVQKYYREIKKWKGKALQHHEMSQRNIHVFDALIEWKTESERIVNSRNKMMTDLERKVAELQPDLAMSQHGRSEFDASKNDIVALMSTISKVDLDISMRFDEGWKDEVRTALEKFELAKIKKAV